MPRAKKPRTKPKKTDGTDIRLNRFLAMVGVGARRACDEMIAAGRVQVDGKRVTDPSCRVVPGVTTVTLDGRSLNVQRPLVLVLNKPTGIVSTVTDPQGRPTVIDLCKRYARRRRLFPVGRLDINTSGLILLTNDGMLCYRLTHPRYEVARTYQVRVRGFVDAKKIASLSRLASPRRPRTAEQAASLRRGSATDRSRGRASSAQTSVERVRDLGRESILRVTLREGRNRQVRKMCEAVGLRVVRLRRLRYGPISVKGLPLGAARPLEPKELERLRRAAGL